MPILSVMSSQQLAIGTSLCAMLAPTLMSSIVHYRANNLALGLIPPMMLGSCAGAYLGGKLSTSLTDQQQRLIFGVVLACLSLRMALKKGKR